MRDGSEYTHGQVGSWIEPDPLGQLGAKIRELRKERRLSLANVSMASGVSVGMLSHIERGKAMPSLKVLEKLRSSLGVSMVDLFPSATSRSASRFVMRSAERKSLHFPAIGLIKQKLSPGDKSDLEMLLLVIAPGGGSGPEPWTRPGEKAGIVLSGSAWLAVGDDAVVLKVGDSFQFDSSRPHRFECVGNEATQILWIIKSHPIAHAVDA